MARGFSYAPGASAEVEEAAAPGLTKERIQELGGSRNALVREAVATRDDCPFGLMVTLAHDHAVPVRAAMAANPKVLHSILDYLSHDRQVAVLCAVAGNPSTGQEILEALAAHRKGEVRDAAAAALDARAEQADTADHTPELRDRVFEESQARRAALLAQSAETGLEAAADDAMAAVEPQEADPLPARPTRSAPVRGFRPPVEA